MISAEAMVIRRMRLFFIDCVCARHLVGGKEGTWVPITWTCKCPALGRRRKRHLGAYYMEDLDEQSCMDIDSLSRFKESSECFLD